MVDFSAIGALATSVQVATDITKSLLSARDAVMTNEKVIQLQTALLDIQRGALVAQSELAALAQENRDLREKLEDRDAWAIEAGKYQLHQPHRGMTVYVRRDDAEPKEAPHWLCPACFQKKQKGFLQNKGRDKTGRDIVWACSTCKAESQAPYTIAPGRDAPSA